MLALIPVVTVKETIPIYIAQTFNLKAHYATKAIAHVSGMQSVVNQIPGYAPGVLSARTVVQLSAVVARWLRRARARARAVRREAK